MGIKCLEPMFELAEVTNVILPGKSLKGHLQKGTSTEINAGWVEKCETTLSNELG